MELEKSAEQVLPGSKEEVRGLGQGGRNDSNNVYTCK
jgi:hypothetical protein